MSEPNEQRGDGGKTRDQLVAELESAEARCRRAEDTLREIEEKYRTLVEQSLQGIFIAQGPPFRLVFVNPAAAEIWGYTPEELTSLPPEEAFSLLHPDDHAVAWQRFANIRERKAVSPHEFRLIRKDGTVRWVAMFGRLIEYQGDLAFQVAILDITERKHAEEVLHRERDLVGRIMETSPMGITVVSREGQIVFANFHAERVLGLTRDEITQRDYNAPEWRITDYDGRPFPDEELPFQRVMSTGQPAFDVRHAIEWPNGQRVLLSINAAPLFDEAGQADGMVATVEDVTERMQAVKTLRENEAKLQSIFRAAPTGIGLVSDRVILEANDRLCIMVGYASDELVGQSARMLYPTDEEFEYVGRVKYAQIREQGSGTVETRFQCKDGRVIDVLLSSTPLDPVDLSVGVTFTALDITRSKQAERERERLIVELQEALTKIKTLRGLIPICAACKKIRDDQGYWNSLEAYIQEHSDAVFTHSICPDCAGKLYPDHFEKGKKSSGAN